MGCVDGVLLPPVPPVSHISNSQAPGCLNITVLTQYFAIYDADGSLAGELAYALGKLAGARRCALCDISHGWNPQGEAAWRTGAQLACGLQWLHRDEQTPAMAEYTRGQLPLVIAQTGDRFTTLLDADGLAACDGDYEAFTAALGAVITPEAVAAGPMPGSGTAATGMTGS